MMFYPKTNIQEEIDDSQNKSYTLFQILSSEGCETESRYNSKYSHNSGKTDEQYIPVCHKCQIKVKQIHSYHKRRIRDLNVFDAKSFIPVAFRRLICPHYGSVVEELPLMNPYERVTRRLTTNILELCRYITIKEIAEHLDLDWKTVKEIHKRFLQDK